jgi:DNA-binding IclR family transcriptional regulator
MKQDSAERGGVQAIARAGAVLRALEDEPAGLGLGALATEVGLPRSTVHRLVMALAAEGLVSAGGSAPIRLGPGLARLGAAAQGSLRDVLRPVLAGLRDELDETVDLAVLDGERVRFLDQLPAEHRLRAVSAVGLAFPLHCTANGKALLAALPPDAALALLPARLERCTPATITSRRALLAALEAIRAAGVATDVEEHTAGVCAVGAAVGAPGRPLAAISVPVPAQRYRGREARLARAVRAAAAEATTLLAGAPGALSGARSGRPA